MAEWSKAAVSKTVIPSGYQGFESPSLRHYTEINIRIDGFTMSFDMVPYRMIRQIPFSPPLYMKEIKIRVTLRNEGFTMSFDMVPYRMIRQIPFSPPL